MQNPIWMDLIRHRWLQLDDPSPNGYYFLVMGEMAHRQLEIHVDWYPNWMDFR